MQCIKLPRFFEPKERIRSCDVFRLSNLTSLRRNSARANVTGKKSYGGEEFRIRKDQSWVTGNSANYRVTAPVTRMGKHRDLVIRQNFTVDEELQILGNKTLSCSDDQITQATDSNVKFTFRQRIGSKLFAFALNAFVITLPGFLHTSIAEASQFGGLGQIRQGVTIVERAFEGLSKFRFDPEAGVQVLDKALTVVSGSTIVDPQVLDEKVESFIRGETDLPEELRKTVLDSVQGSWSNLVDVVTNLNPGTWSESAGTTIQGFVETAVERANEDKQKKSEERAREKQNKAEELSAEAQVRGERVKRELERIELKALLLDAVNSLGEMALQPPRTRGESGLIRRRIQDILERLQELNPVDDALRLIPEVASSISESINLTDPLAHVPTTPTVDGDWRLIYVSETSDNGGDQELPQLPGIALDNIRQKVWQSSTLSSTIISEIPSPLLARNTAEVRFGPFGVLEIAVQGSWENLQKGQTALVSFDTFSARPLEVFGNRITNDLPQLDITIPRSLQQKSEWAVVYVDNCIRINRGRRGQLFLFTRTP